MDSMTAFALGKANRGRPSKVFDWDKAARLIKERKPEEASAGLQEDWFWTGGAICKNGQPVPRDDTYTYLSSTWATPILRMDGEDVECFLMEADAPDWDEHTYWPESALAILNA